MNQKQLLWLLKLCSFLIFIGRAYEHLYWDAPFRTLLWDQNLFGGIVENIFNTSWNDYVTSKRLDYFIQNAIRINGLFYAFCAYLSLTIRNSSTFFLKTILTFGGFSLLFLSFLLSKSKFFHIAMFLEHAIQFGTPFALLYCINRKKTITKIVTPLKILVALTFASHGLYALGTFYPLPGKFVVMTLNIIPISECIVKRFLFTAGILDFIAVLFIFIPKLQKTGLIYACIWGLVTAFARVFSGFSYDISFSIIHQYLYATVFRIPHGLVPLLLFFIIKSTRNKKLIKSLNLDYVQ
jgi:hypothetical protein